MTAHWQQRAPIIAFCLRDSLVRGSHRQTGQERAQGKFNIDPQNGPYNDNDTFQRNRDSFKPEDF